MDREEINRRLEEAGYIEPSKPSLRAMLEAIAFEEGLVLNPGQVHKIEAMEEAGRCYCTAERKCPCRERHKEIYEHGSCLCRVLVTPAYLERQDNYKPREKVKKVKRRLDPDSKQAERKMREMGY